ncbi:hypothetical protein ACWDTG_25915 [Rhodococcus zopfii]
MTTHPSRPIPVDTAAGARSGVPYLPMTSVIILVLAAVGTVIDVILAKGALDVVLNETEFISAITAIGIALIAVGTAAGAGLAARRRHGVVSVIAFIAWLMIGVALTSMRWNRNTLNGMDENLMSDKVLALLMLAVFIAAGVEISVHGSQLLVSDSFFATRSARRKIARIDRRRQRVVAQYGRVGLALRGLTEKRERAERQHEMAQFRIGHIEKELMAFARDRIAEALAHPEKTGLIRQPVDIGNDGGSRPDEPHALR